MKREYGIDLLKIVAMLCIVMHHILFWGGWGFCAGQTGVKGVALEVLDATCLFHVNCFVLASGWIMSRLDFKIQRIVRLWMLVWGYSLVFVLFAWLCCPQIQLNLKEVARNLLPISMDRYWFFTQYTILFFTMPILNCAIRNLDRRTLITILITGFLCFSIHPFVFKTDIFHLNRGYSALWFAYLYVLAGAMSIRGLFSSVTIRCATLCAVTFCLLGVLAYYLIPAPAHLFRAYNSPFLFGYSVSMLSIFSQIHVTKKIIIRCISVVAPSVFSVYVIHSNPLFRLMTNWNAFWTDFIATHSAWICVVTSIVVALLIFGVSIAIDLLRKELLRFWHMGWLEVRGE